ncbi:MAG: GAF domain-containing protein, partial [Deltaproteobacteria bacterium]|nr:GAF domain-containing protein [Deltaproteobacteria bacterium]
MSLIGNLRTLGQRLLNKSYTNAIITILFILASAGLTYYCHWVLRTEVIFSHFFYIPIALAGFWWGRRGAWVAVLLGALLMASNFLSNLDVTLMAVVFRSMMLVAVGLVVGLLRERALRSERDLRETRDYLDSLIRYANAPIVVWDREGKVSLFNAAFEDLTGHRADEVIGRPLEILFSEATKDTWRKKIEQTLKGQRWEGVEIPIRSKGEQERLLLWNSANIYAPDGQTLMATIAQGQDITLRKQTEEALQSRAKGLENHGRVTESTLEQRVRELAAYERIMDAMLHTFDLDERLEIGLKELMNLTGAEKAGMSLVEGDRLVMRKQFGFSEAYMAWAGDLTVEEIPSGEEITVGWNDLPDLSSRLEAALKKEGVKSWATVPLRSEKGFLGIIVLASGKRQAFSREQMDIFSVLAGSLTLMLEQSSLYRTAQERLIRLTTLREIDCAISANLSLEGIIDVVLQKVSPHIWVDAVGISLIDWERKRTILARLHLPGDLDIEGEAFHLSDSLLDELAVEKRPVIIYDVKSDPRVQNHRDIARKHNLTSYVGVPLLVQGRAVGVLHLFTVKPCRFGREDLDFFATLAGQAAISVQNAWLYEDTKRLDANMEDLAKATSSFIQVGEGEELARQTLVSACGITGVKTGVLFWRHKDTNTLKLAAGVGIPEEEIIRAREKHLFPVGPGVGPPGLVAFTGKPLLVPDMSKGPMWEMAFMGNGSAYLVPLVCREQLFGVYVFLSAEPNGFSSGQCTLAGTFSAYVSSALENVRLFKETERAYEELRMTQRQLVQIQKMEAIGTLAGGIAHDFNNILTAIIGYTELAREAAPEGSRVQAHLQEVFRAGMRAKDLVQQILIFSRQSKQEQKPLQTDSIVKEGLKLLRASIPTTIEIRPNIERECGTVLGDPTQIYQVLVNLCTNAAHAMGEKGGVLEVSLMNVDLDADAVAQHPGLKPGLYVRLTVNDTGHGMDRAVMEQIFHPFFTTKGPGEGTGMGLAVVHGIVKSHGGAITVDSEPGRGATFHVYFPRIERGRAPEAEAAASVPTGSERILFVDDEKALVDMIKQMIESLGYKVAGRTSSIEALEAFRAQPDKFDLVITDQTMPNMTGKMLAKELLRIRPDIPIILCTGYSELITEEKAKAMGIRELVMKPVVR